MTPAGVIQQINDIISLLVREGLSDHQRQPAMRQAGGDSQIGIPDSPDLSVSLKGKRYTEIYDELRKAEAYHVRMLDGALVQMLYTFERRTLKSHRLAYFPSPLLEMYDAVPESYDTDEWYGDIIGEFSVKFPIRFDFASSNDKHVDPDHPKSHLTLGQYEGCRIPVVSPLTPARFMRFILRNFYNPCYFAVNLDAKALEGQFSDTITDRERSLLHVSA